MKHYLVLLLFLPLNSYAVDAGGEVVEWYISEYAPYFDSPNPSDAAAIKGFYVDGHFQHVGSDLYVMTNTEEEWSSYLKDEIEAGWTGSEVVSVSPITLNSSNVALTVKWLRKGSGEVCHWYLVTKNKDRWQFTNLVAGVTCATD